MYNYRAGEKENTLLYEANALYEELQGCSVLSFSDVQIARLHKILREIQKELQNYKGSYNLRNSLIYMQDKLEEF